MAVSSLSCGGDAGVLVTVLGDNVSQHISRLELIVAVEDQDHWLIDAQASGSPAEVRGRDLRSNPYELWLQPSSDLVAPTAIQLMARGWREQDGKSQLSTLGMMVPPQRFIEGKLLRRAVQMRALGEGVSSATPNGCFTARIETDDWRFALPQNRDCDPVRVDATPPDCDDEDDTRFPGNAERCDGKDNDCNGTLGPASGPCFALSAGESGSCRIGTRRCERSGEGAGECRPGDGLAPETFCARFEACVHLADPQRCLERFRQRRRCVLKRDSEGTLCGGGQLKLEAPQAADQCHWEMFASGNLVIDFAQGSEQSDSCDPLLELSGAREWASGRVTLDFFADGVARWLVDLDLSVEGVDSCEGLEPTSC